ncbi:N-succinylarginine dihydrolase [Kordiimonas sp. SCSIO 12603]|uniref:N-succinylarginine dihydrolase n=1 Tax=Kordiimonas sp. SCSIO 12603 TaxID=2829596 RepID=UPI0021061ED5|nr:N-succinylarginine dihydrolase [Kordiimonas sp. SCSIO 12603]UTW60090.1 N-succinylarginine dihydrolase [Kordiimonas sp. SCSIO 12603]
MANWQEVNFDGLVGATHNYAGLSYGNVASAKHKGMVANPREGALQGLDKMQHLRDLGMTQGILPPHDRPHISTLRNLGFTGTDAEILVNAYRANPALVANLSSSSTMWTANAATVTPAPDAADGRTHFTPANLAAMYHRSIEAPTTGRILAAMFPEGERFAHHAPIPGGVHMGDEGAANHNRFCADYGEAGVSLFVYGRGAFEKADDLTYPGRQTLESCHSIFAQHGVNPHKMLLVRQNPAAINAGAFHNDVVSVCNKNVFFYHEEAFEDPAFLCEQIQKAMGDVEMQFVKVPAAKVPMADAVSSYLFNSQLISTPGRDGMTLILPTEVEETASTKAYVDELVASGGPISNADYMDVRQSMRNGGGPACLRLRVALSDDDIAAMGSNSIITDDLLGSLRTWVKKHYRDRVMPEDLGDVSLMEENFAALDELTQILKIGSVYDFQRA